MLTRNTTRTETTSSPVSRIEYLVVDTINATLSAMLSIIRETERFLFPRSIQTFCSVYARRERRKMGVLVGRGQGKGATGGRYFSVFRALFLGMDYLFLQYAPI